MGNKSPLRYPGGKTRACKILYDTLSSRVSLDNYNKLISPFVGGASFELYLQDRHEYTVVANDKFTPLFVFWQTLKGSAEDLIGYVEDMRPVSKEAFMTYRDEIMDETDALAKAAMYFVINRCSFSGATLSGGFSQQSAEGRLTNNSMKLLRDINLQRIYFYNRDCLEFLELMCKKIKTSEDVLVFLDPPYDLGKKGNKLYGDGGDMHENFDHEALHTCLMNLPSNFHWIMTYNNSERIKKLYTNSEHPENSEIEIIETAWTYGMNVDKKSSEIIIMRLPA
jgi:DNA adenine methylase